MYYGTLKDGKHSPGLEESFETKLYAQEEIPWDKLACISNNYRELKVIF